MRLWTSKYKYQARIDTLLSQKCVNQYWSVSSVTEAQQLLDAGFIQGAQFHGVERVASIYQYNTKTLPQLAWHHGDLLATMQRYPDFCPSLVNADLIAMGSTAADYVARLLHFLESYPATLIVNLILERRGHKETPDSVLAQLQTCQQFRHAMRTWKYNNQCYTYPGIGALMGTFVFDNQPSVCYT